jgi:hypothetical protein
MTGAVRGLFVAFASLGATAAVIPAVLPAAGQAIGAPLLEAIPALFGGLLVGVLLSGPAMRVLSPVLVAAMGCLVQAGGLVVVSLAVGAGVFVLASAFAGLGFGLVEAAGSVAAKSVTGAGSTAIRLSALTGTVAVMAALTPVVLLVGSSLIAHNVIVLMVAALPLAAGLMLGINGRRTRAIRPARTDTPRGLQVRRLAGIVPFAIALPIYVGVETVFAGWSAVLPAAMLEIDPALAGLGTSAFWALMAAGRYLAVVRSQHGGSASHLVVGGAVIGAIALAAAAAASGWNEAVGLAAIAVAVLAIAPSYGIIVGLALDRLSDTAAGDAMGVLVACGALGGVAVPAAVLMITSDPASPATFVICAILLLVLAVLVARVTPRAVSSPRTAEGVQQ